MLGMPELAAPVDHLLISYSHREARKEYQRNWNALNRPSKNAKGKGLGHGKGKGNMSVTGESGCAMSDAEVRILFTGV